MDENEKTIRKTYSLPSRIVTQEDGDTFVRTLTYTACEDGSCELLCIQSNGIQESILCNPNGITLLQTVRQADGTVSYRLERTLDENGRVAGEICSYAHGYRTEYTEYRYDTTGNVTEKLDYDSKERLSLRTVITRDAEGKPIQHTVYDVYGEEIRILTWEYDERGRKTQQTEDDFMEMGSARYTYGENENGSRWECATIYGGWGDREPPCGRIRSP